MARATSSLAVVALALLMTMAVTADATWAGGCRAWG
jgi:hypothetical protein